MKKVLILTSLIVAALSLQAKVITPERAMKVAAAVADRNTAGMVQNQQRQDMKVAYTAMTADKADFYVINKNQGFVIVSADDVIGETVLGYSDKGQFDYDNMSDNAKWWLSQYQEQIEYLRQHGGQAVMNKTPKGSVFASVVVPPLLGDNHWHQSEPYNNMCPLLPGSTTGRCVVGCGATSVAQVMWFHKWPLKGSGTHSYSWNGKTLTARFSNSVYDWQNMLPAYVNDYTDTEASAVALLSRDVGYSIDMDYGESSGSYGYMKANALKSYFKYSSTVSHKSRSGMSTSSWDALIKNELNNFRPIPYEGHGSDGGHAFVIDGYAENDYFHFNFGWGGSDDGYYLSAVAGEFPSSQSMNLNVFPADHANRIEVDGIFYNRLSSTDVQVTYPDETSQYAGDLVIPSTVTIDTVTYVVSQIGNVAFANCNLLTSVTLPETLTSIGGNSFWGCADMSIIVPWTTPLPVTYSTFDVDACSSITLVVPEGTVQDYSTAEGWRLFNNITDGSENINEWGEWEPFETGSGTFTYKVLFSGDIPMPARVRTSLQNPDICQVMVEGFGFVVKNASTPGYVTISYGGSSLMFTLDKSTNQCVVPRQKIGYYVGYGDMYVSDFPTYRKTASYTSYPCTYDPDNGTFTLSLVYSASGSSYFGPKTEIFQLDGMLKDFSIDATAANVTETAAETGTQKVTLALGADIEKVIYATVRKSMSEEQVLAYAELMNDGSAVSTEFPSSQFGKPLTLNYPRSGKYTTVVCGYDSKGNMQTIEAIKAAFYPQANWVSLGKANYTDDFVTAGFPKVKQYTYKVEVEQNTLKPGLIRLKNPYGTAYPSNSKGAYTTDNVDVYLEIDATTPSAIYLPTDQAMNITLNAKTHGEMSISSKAGDIIEAGGTLNEAKAQGLTGSFTGSVITFPANSLTAMFPLKSDEWLDANVNGGFALDLTGLVNPDDLVADTTLYIAEYTAAPGTQVEYPVYLKNTKDFCGFQGDLFFPEGITPVLDEYGDPQLTKSSRLHAKATLEGAVQADGSLRLLCYSTKNYAINEENGEICTVLVNIDSSVADGNYDVALKNIVLTTTSAGVVKADDQTSVITIQSATTLPGDANGDGTVDISDISLVASYILGDEPAGFDILAADFDGDGDINVVDIGMIANYILRGSEGGEALERTLQHLLAVED